MANPISAIFSGGGGTFGKIVFRIVGSIMRGESPQDCFRDLASTIPELQKYDANNLNAEAHKLCQERGINEAKITAEIKESVASIIK